MRILRLYMLPFYNMASYIDGKLDQRVVCTANRNEIDWKVSLRFAKDQYVFI